MNLLYCDDDQDDIEFFRRAVAKINSSIRLTTTCDCEKALALLSDDSTPPHGIFLDLHLPKMDGLECAIAIKRDKKLKKIPITILSNDLRKTTIEQFNRLGIYSFISKTNYEDLESSLRNILGEEDNQRYDG